MQTTNIPVVPHPPSGGSLADAPLDGPPHFLDLGSSPIAYWRMGRGPDVLFVHGWPLHSQTYRKIADRLSEDFTCHFIDLPGTGRSGWDESIDVGLVEHANTLLKVIEALQLRTLSIIGHDSGGAIARLVGARLGARLEALVLSGTEIPGHHPFLVQMIVRALGTPVGAPMFGMLMKSPKFIRSRYGFGGCFIDLSLLEGDFSALFIAPLLQDKRALEGQLRLMRGLDWSVLDGLADVHRQIVAPVRFIWGEHDPYFPVAKARKMAEQFGNGSREVDFHVLAPARLLVHEECPDEFAELTAEFLVARFAR